MGFFSQLARVEMSLCHVLYISYLVTASRLRHLVPEMLPLAVVGKNEVFVSIVVLQSFGVHLSYLPFPRFTYNQINLRTYVIDPHSRRQAVFFLKSGVTSPAVSRLTRSIGIPWQRIGLSLATDIDNQAHYRSYRVSGGWGERFSLSATESPSLPESVSPFADMESAVDYLVRPLIGFFGQKGGVGRFKIWHAEVKPRAASVEDLRFPLFDSLRIVDQGRIQKPDSVLLVPEARFYIYMPPSRLKQA
jgi:hypothetical protein